MTDEIPTEALEAAARAASGAYETWREPQRWQVTPDQRRNDISDRWLTAVHAAAPFLIAEGRRQRDAETDKAIIDAVAEVDRQWCANIEAAGVDLESAVTATIAQLRSEVDRLRMLVRTVELYGTGYRWRRPDGPELLLDPVEVDVFVADHVSTLDDVPPNFINETPALMARYERELRVKIAAELRQSATIMEPVAADYYRKIADFVDGHRG